MDRFSFQVFFSNQLELLYQELKQKLFVKTTPFAKRMVVVNGPPMKKWLLLRMAQDPQLNIAMGLEFIYLSQAFDFLVQLTSPFPLYFPTQLELNLKIEKELFYLLSHFTELTQEEQKEWFPVFNYLKVNPSQTAFKPLSLSTERRLIEFSDQITQNFQEYNRYGRQLVDKWKISSKGGWQASLWTKLFNKETQWSCLAQALSQPLHFHRLSGQLHFFSVSFLTTNEFSFLNLLSGHLPTCYYALSPCAVFWSDIKSDKEATYLQNFWQKKGKISSDRLLKLEEYLRDRNPLLANFGRIGREMAQQIEESSVYTKACYSLSSKVQATNPDLLFQEDLYLLDSKSSLTLLQALQADLLLMRNPQDHPVFNFEDEAGSIQLHLAVNKQREIEILYHNLLALLSKDCSLKLSDILIMSPQMREYIPYIHSLFGNKSSLLDYQILDLELQINNEITQGFLQLISLSEGRWSSAEILQLFEHRLFQKQHQLTLNDYYLIKEWVKQVDIRWGQNLSHRNELLQKKYCEKEMVEETSIGTWEYGFSRLLSGLTTVLSEQTFSFLKILPSSSIDFSQADLLGRWISLLHSLKDDLSPLQDRTQMTIEEWVNYLSCLLDNYFQTDFEDSSLLEEKQVLKLQLERLKLASRFCEKTVFSFQFVKKHLLSLLNQKQNTYQDNHLEAVRFCSFVPLRSIPARVIGLIGMQEGSFPRFSSSSALNLMQQGEEKSYVPSETDYDRYLFLEVIHSTQDCLLMSYPCYQPQEEKEIQPSLVVEELFNYLDKFYTIQKQKISDFCLIRHPFNSFDKEYFKKNRFLVNFSQQNFLVAQSYYQIDKQKPYRFLSHFNRFYQLKPPLNHSLVIDLKSLSALARHPVKFHLNKSLEIYLQEKQDRQYKVEEEWSLSPLNKYHLLQYALKESFPQILYRAEKEGKLPFGLFKQVASNCLKEEIDEINLCLKNHAIERREIFEFEFCASCSQPTQLNDHHWLFPALSLVLDKSCSVTITGKLPQVTPKGLLVLSKGSFVDAWKAWPAFLLYCHALQLYPHALPSDLIMVYAPHAKTAFFNDPLLKLKQFIDYYIYCLNYFSPLLPEWIPAILEGNAPKIQEKMRQAFKDKGGNYQSLEMRWILNPHHLLNAEHLIESWQSQTQMLLGDLKHFWYPEKSQKNLVSK